MTLFLIRRLKIIHILNLKVVPKIIFPETSSSVQQNQQQQQSQSHQTTSASSAPPPLPPKPPKPVISKKPQLNNDAKLQKHGSNDSESGKIETIVGHLIDELIETIELQSMSSSRTTIEPTQLPLSSNNVDNNNLANNSNHIIEVCLTSLKHLCHTFAKSHVFLSISDLQEQINKSFASLFITPLQQQQQKQQNGLIILDDQQQTGAASAVVSGSGVYAIKMKPDCLGYLQSFQILNKLLIKILLFPREATCVDKSNGGENCGGGGVDGDFEEWIKDLMVISCSSCIQNVNNGEKRCFEFLYFTKVKCFNSF